MGGGRERRQYRVLHVITRLIRGGADRAVVECIENLDADRYRTDLVVGGQSELEQVQRPSRLGRLIVVPSLVRQLDPVCDLRALWSLYRIIKEGAYDIVHTHTAKAGFLGRLAARLAGTPYVLHHLHGISFPPTLPWISRKLYIGLERMAAGWTDTIVPVGHDLLRIYEGNHIGQPDQYQVIHYPLDLGSFIRARGLSRQRLNELRRSLGVKPGEIVVGKVGRLVKGKGFDYYIEAASLVARDCPNVKFLIVGEGDQRVRLQEQVEDLGLEGRVFFTGFREDIAEVMATLDIFAFTSLWEGLPQVLVQTAALGKPVVAFEVQGVNEIVDNDKSGYIVPSRDVVTFAARVKELCQSAELRERMGAHMLETFTSEEWQSDVIAEQIQCLYERALERHYMGQPAPERSS